MAKQEDGGMTKVEHISWAASTGPDAWKMSRYARNDEPVELKERPAPEKNASVTNDMTIAAKKMFGTRLLGREDDGITDPTQPVWPSTPRKETPENLSSKPRRYSEKPLGQLPVFVNDFQR